MGLRLLTVAAVLAWRTAGAVAAPAASALPWLHNFVPAAEASVATPGVVARMTPWRAADRSCSAAAYGGLAITAEVSPAPGLETVLASFTQGVLVLDAGAALLALALPLGCQGSADELGAIAAGDARIGQPVIALAVTAGGHRRSATWLVLYRVAGAAVVPLWSGIVEDHTEDRTRAGEVTLLPGALVYRAPSGVRTLWSYDPDEGRYVPVRAEGPGV
jgi:hypothetical protein